MPVRHIDPLLGLCDPVSALTHGLLGVCVVLSAWFLLRRAGRSPLRLASLWIYVVGVGSMFLFSATYHALPYGDPLKAVYWKLDHASVWIGLAAVHTPIQVLCGHQDGARRRLATVWGLAIVGAGLEVGALDRLPGFVSPLLYVCMGWACFPILLSALRGGGRRFFAPLLGAGILATLGGFADAAGRPQLWPGFIEAHEVTHLFTSLGGIVYGWAIYTIASGEYEQAPDGGREPVYEETVAG